jgi:hypothetical protein
MQSLHRLGGIGALVAGATFVIGLVMFATMLVDYTTATDATRAVEFLVANQVPLYAWNLVIHIVFGIVLVPMVLALRQQFAGVDSPLPRIAAVFGLIWSGAIVATGMVTNVGWSAVVELHATDPQGAVTLWSAVETVANGLGGGNEVLGGMWVLLVSIAALGAGVFPRWVNVLGIVMGIAALVTVVPPLEPVGAVFGLGLVVWFVRVGMALLAAARAEPDHRVDELAAPMAA